MYQDYTLRCTQLSPSTASPAATQTPEPAGIEARHLPLIVVFWTVMLSTITGLAWPASALIVGLGALAVLRRSPS